MSGVHRLIWFPPRGGSVSSLWIRPHYATSWDASQTKLRARLIENPTKRVSDGPDIESMAQAFSEKRLSWCNGARTRRTLLLVPVGVPQIRSGHAESFVKNMIANDRTTSSCLHIGDPLASIKHAINTWA